MHGPGNSDYDRGYEAGKNGDFIEDLGMIGAGIFASEDYNEGYTDGTNDRGDD